MAKTVDTGCAAEYRFASEALSRNYLPLWPSSSMYPYDMILDTGTKLHRIQVKSSIKKSYQIEFEFRMIDGASRRRYTKKDIDFIAFYLSHYEIWYIFPVTEVGIKIRVHPELSNCPYEKYIDAWHLLE